MGKHLLNSSSDERAEFTEKANIAFSSCERVPFPIVKVRWQGHEKAGNRYYRLGESPQIPVSMMQCPQVLLKEMQEPWAKRMQFLLALSM